MLTVTLLIVPPLTACLASRICMYRFLDEFGLNMQAFLAVICPGACLDMLLVLCPSLFAFLLFSVAPSNMPCAFLGVMLMAAPCVVVTLLNAADTFIFHQTHTRFFHSLLPELGLSNILTATTAKQKLFIGSLLLAVCGHVTLLAFFHAPPAAAIFFLAVMACAMLAARLFLGRLAVDTVSMTASSSSWNIYFVADQMNKKLACIKDSAVINFLKNVKSGLQEKHLRPRYQAYSPDEERLLRTTGLVPLRRYASPPPRPRLYPRIVLICLESVGQNMLPFYNERIPAQVMPFMQTLLSSYPRLDNFRTSHSLTGSGLHALHMSRLAFQYDFKHGMGRIDGITGLLKKAGYESCLLCGSTRYYGSWEPICTSLLQYDHFLSEETLRGVYTAPKALQWGIADSVVYDYAVNLLDAHRDTPILLTIHTANTHPDFYHSLKEEEFPEIIRETQSPLLRSLYEVDRDLMMFFKKLGKKKLFDENTLIILTSDHSPHSGPDYLKVTGEWCFEPNLLPCMFITPDKESPFRELAPDTVCGQLDMLPTLIDAFGLPRLPHVMGRSLFLKEANTVLSQYNQILHMRAKHADCAVDLTPGVDPGEGAFLKKWYINKLLEPYTALQRGKDVPPAT